MNKVFVSILTSVSCLLPGLAYGAWASGGGELFRDSMNPWFIQNTLQVRYCIEIDEANFGVSRDQAQNLVQKAIAYWKNEFSYAMPFSTSQASQIKIATQQFILGSCQANTDLRLQFGVLTSEQKAEFARLNKRPQQFVGIAVRTDYDEVHLRAKGFIYLSPEKGPLKMEGDVLNDPWSYAGPYLPAERQGGILHKVLVHEFGHVFGLPHSNSVNSIYDSHAEMSIMDADYPEAMVGKLHKVEMREDLDWITNVFSPRRGKYGYLDKPSQKVVKFLGSPTSEFYYPEFVDFKMKGEEIEVVADNTPMGPVPRTTVLGKIVFNPNQSPDPIPSVKVRLNPKQKVFPRDRFENEIQGPGYASFHWSGTYTSFYSGLHRQVFVSYNPATQSFRVGGLMDGELIHDLATFR